MRFSFFLIALLCFFLVFARSNANSDDLSVFGIRPRMSLDEFKLAAKTYSCRIVDKDDAGEETEYWLSKTVADKFLITTKDGAILQVSPLSHPSEGLESYMFSGYPVGKSASSGQAVVESMVAAS